ncbi:MAG: hypothetical protein RMJ98_09215 [Myxococcales bacterium]|nr:hypothetical protein [Myxococcales bacterium]
MTRLSPLLPWVVALALVLLGALAFAQDPPGPPAMPEPAASTSSAALSTSAPLELEPPRAAPPPPTVERPTPRSPPPPYLAPQWGVGGRISPRYVWVRDAGFDPYAINDLLIGVHVEGMLRVWNDGPLSAWILAGWSTGGAGSSGTARQLSSSMSFHNLQIGVDGRYTLNRRISLLARAAPGAHRFRTSLASGGLPYSLASTSWTWSAEATAGAAVMIGAVGNDDWPSARMWVSADLGYAMTGKVDNKLRADLEAKEEQKRVGTTTLPSLPPSGVLFWICFSVTF